MLSENVRSDNYFYPLKLLATFHDYHLLYKIDIQKERAPSQRLAD